jgi:NAD(P)H-nitrite reductase large subunit
MTRRYLIVGNGPAGVAAAEAIRARDDHGEILIVGDENSAFYSRPGLAYLLTGSIPERQLFCRPDREYRQQRIHRIVARAAQLDPAGHRLVLADGKILAFDRILLAVGARAVRPHVPGIDLPGVVTLDNLEDARRILRLARRTRRAIVVGGGITAVELAEGIASQGAETHYLLRKDRYWGSVLEREESALVEHRLEGEGIRLHRNCELLRVVERHRKAAGVQLSDGTTLDCQMVAVAVGIKPRTELAAAAGLEVGRGVWTSPTLETSEPDVFAAGDAAEVLDPDTGERVLDSLWSLALEQGACAGANMAGERTPYPRDTPFNVTRIGGITTTLIGAVGSGQPDDDLMTISRGDSQAWRQRADAFAVESDVGESRVRVLVGAERLVGAVVMGDQTLSRSLQLLIRQRADIRGIRDSLLHGRGDLSRLVSLAGQRASARAA